MNGQTLSKLYDLNFMAINNNLEGITSEESFFQPQQAGNCSNWVLGHIVATRNQIMKLIGENPIWSEEKAAPYLRGSVPLINAEGALPLEKMLTDLRASQDKILSGLQRMSAVDMETPTEDGTKFEQLAILQFHEAYHAGQLGILRRLIGKAGAIT